MYMRVCVYMYAYVYVYIYICKIFVYWNEMTPKFLLDSHSWKRTSLTTDVHRALWSVIFMSNSNSNSNSFLSTEFREKFVQWVFVNSVLKSILAEEYNEKVVSWYFSFCDGTLHCRLIVLGHRLFSLK